MKKLAVLTAMVFLFGVAGIAAAFGPEVNNNDLVGAQTGGTAVNDSLASGNTTYANIPIANDEVKGGAAANDQSLAVKDSLNNNDVSDIANDKSIKNNDTVVGKAAANDGSLAVNDTLNNNDLFSNNKTAAASKGGQATVDGNNTQVEADKGGQAANNGGTNVSQEALFLKNEKHAAGESVTTVGATTTTTVGAGSINGSNSTYVAAGANNQAANAKYKSDNPSADDGSQQVIGDGDHTLNLADDGAVVATGAAIVTQNEADKGGMINTGEGNLNKVTNEGKYAAQNASQDIKETNYEIEAEGFGSIAAFGDVLTMKAEKGSTAIGPGSAVSFTEIDGKVEDNKIDFGHQNANSEAKSGWAITGKADSGSADSGEAKSGWAFTGKADSGDADTGKNDSGSAFSLSGSKSKSGAAGAAAFGGSSSGGNGAAALGGSKSESEATAVAVDAISLFGKADADADSDDSKALSVNVAVAKDGDSKNVSKADAASGSSDSKSKADATSGYVDSGDADSGYADSGDSTTGTADSGDATSGYADSGDSTTGSATNRGGRITNSFTTGRNTLTVGTFNGLGNFFANTGVNTLNQQSINVNAVVGGNAFGR